MPVVNPAETLLYFTHCPLHLFLSCALPAAVPPPTVVRAADPQTRAFAVQLGQPNTLQMPEVIKLPQANSDVCSVSCPISKYVLQALVRIFSPGNPTCRTKRSHRDSSERMGVYLLGAGVAQRLLASYARGYYLIVKHF